MNHIFIVSWPFLKFQTAREQLVMQTAILRTFHAQGDGETELVRLKTLMDKYKEEKNVFQSTNANLTTECEKETKRKMRLKRISQDFRKIAENEEHKKIRFTQALTECLMNFSEHISQFLGQIQGMLFFISFFFLGIFSITFLFSFF